MVTGQTEHVSTVYGRRFLRWFLGISQARTQYRNNAKFRSMELASPSSYQQLPFAFGTQSLSCHPLRILFVKYQQRPKIQVFLWYSTSLDSSFLLMTIQLLWVLGSIWRGMDMFLQHCACDARGLALRSPLGSHVVRFPADTHGQRGTVRPSSSCWRWSWHSSLEKAFLE